MIVALLVIHHLPPAFAACRDITATELLHRDCDTVTTCSAGATEDDSLFRYVNNLWRVVLEFPYRSMATGCFAMTTAV